MSVREITKVAKSTKRLDRFLCLDDFEPAAKKFLPHSLFRYVVSAAETGASHEYNLNAFRSYAFVTRVLRDISRRSIETTLLGKSYAAPFGIAPMGISALTAYRGDLVLARAARAANIPMIMSGASLIPLEDVAKVNPDAWFQGYLSGASDALAPMLDRVERAAFRTLVVTVDTQGKANRENFLRAGFTTPLRPSLRLFWSGVTRPRWLYSVFLRTLLFHGMPHFENSSHTRGVPIISANAEREFSGRATFSWEHVAQIRKRWKGHLVVKGILSAADTAMAREQGVDAIVASNHGGRQLDGAISPLHVLPELVAAARGIPVIIDGGFRRGSDIVKALALGASFVLIGRPFNYAAGVAGEDGVRRAIDLLSQEVSRDMAMVGYTAVEQIRSECLRHSSNGQVVGGEFLDANRTSRWDE